MKGQHSAILLGLLMLTATGCAALVAGAGAGAGVYTYVTGELKRTYLVDYDTAVTATQASLEALRIKVTERQSGATETTISGMRTDETPVVTVVRFVGASTTEISVRSGVVGYWDKSGSELIHATIVKRLPRTG